MKQTKIPDIAEMASGQWGMLTSRQAAVVGVDARTLARLAKIGELERLAHGIYRLAGTPHSPYDDLRVTWLSFDPGRTAYERINSGPIEAVSHRSAAVLHGLGDIDADVLEFSAQVRHQTRRPDIIIHRAEIPDGDWQLVDGLPAITPLRTIGDLAAAHIDQGHLAGAVRDAIARHDVPVSRIGTILSPWARSYGAMAGHGDDLVDRLLSQSGVPESALELSARVNPEARQSLIDELIRAAKLDALASPRSEIRIADGLVEYLVRALRRRNDEVPVEVLRYVAALASAASTNPAAAVALRELMDALHAAGQARTAGVHGDC